MSTLVTMTPTNTYATRANAIKAFEKKFAEHNVRYVIMQTEEGRFYPVGLGENAVQNMVHFHFCVLG